MEQNEIGTYFSSAIELSEHKTYIDLTSRLCYFDEPNYNDTMLPSENASERAQTLLNQPVVAKYISNAGNPDLGGHEVRYDKDGNVTFGTVPIGTHIAVSVREDTVPVKSGETKTLPCLFATMRIWTRYKNVASAVKRLFSEGRLHSSWEILVSNYEYKDGIKVIKDYVFEGNALLGTNNPPAYGDAAVALSLAESETAPELILAEALAMDLEEKEEKTVEDPNINTNELETNEAPAISEEPTPETTPVKDEPSEQIASLMAQISERDGAIVAANQKIADLTDQLNTQAEEMAQYKDFYEKAEAARLAAEIEAAKERMMSDAKKSKLFTEEELASEEVKAILDSGDEDAMKKLIAEKFIKSLDTKDEPETETSEVTPTENIKADVTDGETMDYKKFMKKLLED